MPPEVTAILNSGGPVAVAFLQYILNCLPIDLDHLMVIVKQAAVEVQMHHLLTRHAGSTPHGNSERGGSPYTPSWSPAEMHDVNSQSSSGYFELAPVTPSSSIYDDNSAVLRSVTPLVTQSLPLVPVIAERPTSNSMDEPTPSTSDDNTTTPVVPVVHSPSLSKEVNVYNYNFPVLLFVKSVVYFCLSPLFLLVNCFTFCYVVICFCYSALFTFLI